MTLAQATDTSDLSREVRSWCEGQIRRAAGAAFGILSATPVASRTARVHRITAANRAGEDRRYYLKQFAATESPETLGPRLEELSRIAAGLQLEPALTPYVVVAADLEQRLLLTNEMPGDTILAIHRRVARRLGAGADTAVAAWRGVGLWLATLHYRTVPAVPSTSRGAELAAYAAERFAAWAQTDARYARLAADSVTAVERVAARCQTPLMLRPCHGDVSGLNILVRGTVGLIDFDDVRFDLPALDLSQAVLEIGHLCRVLHTVPLGRVMRRARRALLRGYGEAPPDGPEFWIQHFRNLSVHVLTLAQRRSGISLSRVTDELQYARTVSALRRSTSLVRDSDGESSFWGAEDAALSIRS